MQEHAEIEHDDHGDECFEQEQELALSDQIGFTGFIDEFRNFAHGAVHGEIFQPLINRQAEDQPENAKKNPEEQELMAVDIEKVYLREIGEL